MDTQESQGDEETDKETEQQRERGDIGSFYLYSLI